MRASERASGNAREREKERESERMRECVRVRKPRQSPAFLALCLVACLALCLVASDKAFTITAESSSKITKNTAPAPPADIKCKAQAIKLYPINIHVDQIKKCANVLL
jgi:hypothetical protein